MHLLTTTVGLWIPENSGVIFLLQDTCLVADGDAIRADLFFHVCGVAGPTHRQQQATVT